MKKLYHTFTLIFLLGMLFTVFASLPCQEEPVQENTELAKKADPSSETEEDGSNESKSEGGHDYYDKPSSLDWQRYPVKAGRLSEFSSRYFLSLARILTPPPKF